MADRITALARILCGAPRSAVDFVSRWTSRREDTLKRPWSVPGCGLASLFPPPAENERAPAIPRSSPDELSRAIGASLRAARLRAGLSLKELAQRSRGRYKPSSLGGYERGERAISVLRFCELAQLVGIPADQLMREAMAQHMPQDYREVLLDLSDLPDSDAGRRAAAHAHRVRSMRGDYLTHVVTLRAGDLQVIADATGLGVPALLSALETAVRRVGPG